MVKKGFTLPEVMMTALVLCVVALIAAPIFLQATRFYLMSRTKVELQKQARECLSVITRNIRLAQADTIVIDQENGQPWYSRIAFTQEDGKTVVYAQTGTQLIETLNGRTRTLTSDLRFLNFFFPQSEDMSIVSVSLTLERDLYEGRRKALHVASERVRVMN